MFTYQIVVLVGRNDSHQKRVLEKDFRHLQPFIQKIKNIVESDDGDDENSLTKSIMTSEDPNLKASYYIYGKNSKNFTDLEVLFNFMIKTTF